MKWLNAVSPVQILFISLYDQCMFTTNTIFNLRTVHENHFNGLFTLDCTENDTETTTDNDN